MLPLPQATLVQPGDIRPMTIDHWQQFQQEGEQFLVLAERAFAKHTKAFTTEILYNLAAMAMEKLVMSALMRIGRLPDNHTLGDLATALAHWLPEAAKDLTEPIRALDRFQEICDPEGATIRQPTSADIEAMLQLARCLEQRLRPVQAKH